MNSCCHGCGAMLQTEEKEREGFIPRDLYGKRMLCERCFRMQNYGEYQKIEKENQVFIDMLKRISQTNDLVVLVVDLWNFTPEVKWIAEQLKNDLILVLNKRDLFPSSIKDQKFIAYIRAYLKDVNMKMKDILVMSGKKNYQMDTLYQMIEMYKKTKQVYIVGLTNVGKSTLLNQFTHHYAKADTSITMSILPSTTLDFISIPIHEELVLIDTPGLLEQGCISSFVPISQWKRIVPKKVIAPRTYQIKTKQSILVEDILRIDIDQNDLVFYFSNELDIKRVFQSTEPLIHFRRWEFHLVGNQDIVISGMGFIHIVREGDLVLYTINGTNVTVRDAMI